MVETGLSDFHKMTVTALKATFKKNPPKKLAYRDFKHFSHELFQSELRLILDSYDVSFDLLDDNIMLVVNKLAPLKYKYIR